MNTVPSKLYTFTPFLTAVTLTLVLLETSVNNALISFFSAFVNFSKEVASPLSIIATASSILLAI